MNHMPAIDGLRAVAVLGVLIFHAGFLLLSGGFVGVDVFFVISGFLISKIVADALSACHFSFEKFYVKRLFRLAPALLVTVLISSVLFSIIFPASISRKVSESVLASLLFYSNIHFYFTTDYFSDNSDNPLLHIWSLSVEEQFYFVFPVLIYWCFRWRGRQDLVKLMWVITALSFAGSLAMAQADIHAAFYLMPFRAWEFSLGGLAALSGWRIAERFSAWVLHAGLLVIVLCYLVFSEHMGFPNYWAVLPVAGALMVVVAASSGANSWVLSNPLSQYIGKTSYSIYLVHWPLCCLFAQLMNMTAKVSMLLVVLSVFLGGLSWYFIENPCRHRYKAVTSHVRLLAQATLLFAAVLLISQVSSATGASLWSKSDDLKLYDQVIANGGENFAADECFVRNADQQLPHACLAMARDKPNVLLLGDSHAANIAAPIRANSLKLNLLQATATGCRPALWDQSSGHCKRMYNELFHHWLDQRGKGISMVILSARWETADLAGLAELVQRLQSMGMKVVVVGPSYEYRIKLPLALGLSDIFGVDLVQWMFMDERVELDAHMAQMFGADVRYFSVVKVLCRQECIHLMDGGVPIYFDKDHFTQAGSEFFVNRYLMPFLDQGWY